ncbi:lipoprotein-anchoring transpeptidase ErfK/SrfK [Longimicrobium terrae]|nr:L,D-transpeptidase [Longimicrobium terrae]MBB4634749.1 lipoprotein-anchoring transpeptidase ErfK/SrfK [Longimicrobium terrae]
MPNMKMQRRSLAVLLALAVSACGDGNDAGAAKQTAEPAQQPDPNAAQNAAQVAWDRRVARMSAEELQRARMDESWMEVVQLDPIPGGRNERPNPEKWEQIAMQTVNSLPQHVPLYGDVGGPSVLRTQILLDRALFSPGIMDGNWGKNTAEALYWFQKREGIPATARLDSLTFERLKTAGGSPTELVVARTLSAEDVAGPFTKIPDDIYEHAKLECSCYETLTEKLSEQFHITPDLLQKLNPGVAVDGLRQGQKLNVPAVRNDDAQGRGTVAKLVVSGRGTYLHAEDASGKILYHFPSTLGGQYSPSPRGDFRVRTVTQDPAWHYQPDILVGVPDSEADAMIPKGPNVAVGKVWMALSEPHYGIHGTAEPQTIGYASSNGCVRLTNWDVEFLSRHVRPNTPVEFRDISGQKQAEDPANAEAGASSGAAKAAAPASGSRAATGARGGSTRAGAAAADTPARPSTRTGNTTRGGTGARGTSSTGSGGSSSTSGAAGGTRASTSGGTSAERPKQDEHAGHNPH